MAFNFLIQLLVNGLIIGLLYGVVAMSFVLIYKSSQVVNFAQGEFLLVGAWPIIIFGIVEFFILVSCTIYFLRKLKRTEKISLSEKTMHLQNLDGNEIVENIEKPFFFVKDNYSWHLGIKSAMEHLNIMSKQERMPYQELDEEKHKHVGEIVEQIKKFV